MNQEEATRRVTDVLKVLDDARVPGDLRPIAFQMVWEAGSPPSAQPGIPEARSVPRSSGTSTSIGNLAARVGIAEDRLEDIYGEEEDGTLAVRVPARQISQKKATATVELGLLACAGKQSNGQSATAAKLIRDLCNSYGRLDGPNFAGTMRGADHYWQIIGRGADATFALRRPGWDAAADLMRRLGGSQ
jgi:hypothetical protein